MNWYCILRLNTVIVALIGPSTTLLLIICGVWTAPTRIVLYLIMSSFIMDELNLYFCLNSLLPRDESLSKRFGHTSLICLDITYINPIVTDPSYCYAHPRQNTSKVSKAIL